MNRVTKFAPNEVTKKDVPYLLSLTFNVSATLFLQPKFYVGDFVQFSEVDLPFRKRYKQTFTNKVFEICDIPTTTPPTYSLIDAYQEPVKGKFIELELVKVRDNSSEITKHEWIHGSLSFISFYEYFSSKQIVLIQKKFQWKNNFRGGLVNCNKWNCCPGKNKSGEQKLFKDFLVLRP